jgi:phosphoglycerate dehydrogenase-like enzyme
LDVFEEEPKVHPGLIRNPNVLLVPHMGTWTVEVRLSLQQRSQHGRHMLIRLISDRLKRLWKSGLSKMCGLQSKQGS